MTMRSITRAGLAVVSLVLSGLALAGTAAGSPPPSSTTATVRGTVFGDANANGRPDPGEGVSGIKVTFSNLRGAEKDYTVTTGSGGRYRVVVPTSRFYVSSSGSGWAVVPEFLSVPAGGAELTLRAVRPLGHVLTAAMHFTADTYAPGDTAHIVVTLANTGSATLFGIAAACDRVGDPDELNTGPGWGGLDPDGPGVTLLAHQTRTFDVTATVPEAAQQAGQVVVACDFGYPGIDQGYRPTADDTAKVPGQFGAIAGEVQYYPHGHHGPAVGLAGVRLVLVDPTTCPVITRTATTNTEGHFRLGKAPAGASYQLYIYPPTGWKVRGEDPTHAFIFGNDTNHFGFEVEHGSRSVPDAPTTCASPTPSAPPTGIPVANTGAADPAGFAAAGAAALLVGLVLTLSGRRRRAH